MCVCIYIILHNNVHRTHTYITQIKLVFWINRLTALVNMNKYILILNKYISNKNHHINIMFCSHVERVKKQSFVFTLVTEKIMFIE